MKKYYIIGAVTFSFYLIGCLINYFQNDIFKWLYPKKVYCHRVNSIEMLQEMQPKFRGIELDVIFYENENFFDVNHGNDEYPSIGLKLSKYLTHLNKDLIDNIWLDFKNLNQTNMKQSCLKLDSICNALRIDRKMIIVEAKNAKYLSLFKKSGYKTSYYFNEKYNGVFGADYVSADVIHLKTVKNFFPNKELLFWASNNISFFIKPSPLGLRIFLGTIYFKYKLLSDETVKIVLLKYMPKSTAYR